MKAPLIRIKEEIRKRTENSKHYFNNNGSYTAEIFSGPIHYKDRNSQWQDIDTTVVISDDPNYDFMNVTNSTKTYFKKEISGTAENIKIIKDNSAILIKSVIDLKLLDSFSTEIQKTFNNIILQKFESNEVKFLSIYTDNTKNIDINYYTLNDKLHEEFVINEPMGFPKIFQKIILINAYFKQDNKSIYIYNQTTNKLIGILPPPVMFEKNNSLNINYDLYYEIVNLTKDTFIITKVLEEKGKNWFFSSDRIYPLIIDVDFVAVTNYTVYGYDASYNIARSTSYNIGTDYLIFGQDTNFQVLRIFLKFDTSSIGANTIDTVTLTLTVSADDSVTDFDAQIVKQDWSAQDPIDASNRETVFDNCLTSDIDNNIWRNTNGISINTPYTSGPLSTSWINKSGNTYYSLRSKRDFDNITPTTYEYLTLRTRLDATTAYRPTLNITYVIPEPEQLIIVDNY